MNKNSVDAAQQQRRERWALIACITSLFGLLPLFYLWGALGERAGDHVMFIVSFSGAIAPLLGGFIYRAGLGLEGFDNLDRPMLPFGMGRTAGTVIMASMILTAAVSLIALWRLGV